MKRTYVDSDGTTCSPISRSALAGMGGYGCTSGWVWYSPGSNSSRWSDSSSCGHDMPVEHGCVGDGLAYGSHKTLGKSRLSRHSTPRTCTPSPQDTEHWNKDI